MKQILKTGLLVLSTSFSVFGQELFIPPKPDNVSESDYRIGKERLKSAYHQVVDDNYNIVAIDYWNFATAYRRMGQPKETIYDFLFKAKATNEKEFCDIINKIDRKPIDSSKFYQLLGEDYIELTSSCSNYKTEEEVFDIDEYIKKNNYDKELIYELNELQNEDQKWRNGKGEDLKKTIDVDKVNIIKAEEIVKKYGYPGTRMVGEKFDGVIWLIIQHADLEYQEKYLPLIAKTVKEGQLSKSTLRMLLDRIYHKKTGFQIFGSQAGVPFSDDKTIREVKLKYSL